MPGTETGDAEPFGLAEPQWAMIDGYKAALLSGWSPDERPNEAADQLADIERDPAAFVASRSDRANRDVAGQMFKLPDGTEVRRLPNIERWIWDGSFAGRISLRYQPGTDRLPSYTLGHIGYVIVPWKQNLGYAKRALGLMLREAKRVRLPRVELTADSSNVASQKVIIANGGRFVEAFEAEHYGSALKYRYEIALV